ncbi:hypothetical protein KIN20_028232 [Parelaphostrongylus tenuis]|uniref:Uncharacterized protein n=1 Tax=Parelaphostrongylus tenuis TaxID=148309 RepID=A0AAD5R0Y0_PARTN|nr:hypothetical protein KIN20_028232 [Parelaphostrongylus tenuis]
MERPLQLLQQDDQNASPQPLKGCLKRGEIEALLQNVAQLPVNSSCGSALQKDPYRPVKAVAHTHRHKEGDRKDLIIIVERLRRKNAAFSSISDYAICKGNRQDGAISPKLFTAALH